MSRFTVSIAFACGLTAVAFAQDTKTTTTTKTTAEKGHVQMVTYTGCVQSGSEARTYILDKGMPASRTTTTEVTGTSGTVTTTTTRYELVPGDQVEFQSHVGHKVEVTGMLIPAGNVKTETTTKVERKDAKDTTTKETSKTNNGAAQFRVTSIKNLADSCSE